MDRKPATKAETAGSTGAGAQDVLAVWLLCGRPPSQEVLQTKLFNLRRNRASELLCSKVGASVSNRDEQGHAMVRRAMVQPRALDLGVQSTCPEVLEEKPVIPRHAVVCDFASLILARKASALRCLRAAL